MLEGGMAVSIGRLRPDTQYDYKFVCLSHNTLRGAAGGAVLLAGASLRGRIYHQRNESRRERFFEKAYL